MSSPRNRVYSRLLVLCCAVWSVAFACLAWRLVRLDRRFLGLQSVISTTAGMASRLEAVESGLQLVISTGAGSASTEETPTVADAPSRAAPWRVLGRGRLASWDYIDVRHIDATVRRYYSRRGDATSVEQVARCIAADAEEIARNLSMQETDASRL